MSKLKMGLRNLPRIKESRNIIINQIKDGRTHIDALIDDEVNDSQLENIIEEAHSDLKEELESSIDLMEHMLELVNEEGLSEESTETIIDRLNSLHLSMLFHFGVVLELDEGYLTDGEGDSEDLEDLEDDDSEDVEDASEEDDSEDEDSQEDLD